MSKRILATLGAVAILLGPSIGVRALGEDDLATGIDQINRGQLDKAILTLDGVIQALAGAPDRVSDLATYGERTRWIGRFIRIAI